MSDRSAISWTDYSFPPWFGCSRVSPGCDFCYAEHWTVARFHKAEWGAQAPRVRSAKATWSKPLSWNRARLRGDPKHLVFCSELSDVFDNRAPAEWRDDLWQLIRATPALVWLILTKRPQNFRKMLPPDWGEGYPNVWLGVTAENQREAARRLPLLRRTPATLRFISAEPLLGPLALDLSGIGWVIAGAESSPGKRPGKRPALLPWARDLRDQCRDAGCAFWLKQLVRDGKLVELPELDGRSWAERPA